MRSGPETERAEAAIEYLSHHPQVIQIARVARTFRLDPVALLRDDGDEFLTYVRLAAAQVVHRDEEAAAKKAKSQSKK